MAATKACTQRLQKEYRAILKDPVPGVAAHPAPSNLLEWHFILEGPKDTEYAGGVYHGKIIFPGDYPFKPPTHLCLCTPNGRFAVNTKLCLSFTSHHPETWNPQWNVSTILTGLLSFMTDTQPTTGSVTTTAEEKRTLATQSIAYNIKNPMFRKLFPEWVEEHQRRVTEQEQADAQRHEKQQQTNTQQPDANMTKQAVAAVQQQAQRHQAQDAGLNQAGGRRPAAAAAAGAHRGHTSVWAVAGAALVVALVAGPILRYITSDADAGVAAGGNISI